MAADLRVDSHPPERRRRATVAAAPFSCCCCCCCVHSVGGLAGGIYGSFRRDAPDPETLTTDEALRREAEIKTAQRLAVNVYWLLFAILATVAVFIATLATSAPVEDLIVIAIFLPLGQVAASILTLVWILIRPPARRDAALRRLMHVTLYAFIGALLGIGGTWLTARWL